MASETLVTLVVDYGFAIGVATYLVHYITKKQNGELREIAERLEKIAESNEKMLLAINSIINKQERVLDRLDLLMKQNETSKIRNTE